MQTEHGCEIAPGKWVPPDVQVTVCVYSLHRDPQLWPDPDAFKPERFLDKEETARRHPQAFLPFGLGPRMCIGMRFALEELQIALIRYKLGVDVGLLRAYNRTRT